MGLTLHFPAGYASYSQRKPHYIHNCTKGGSAAVTRDHPMSLSISQYDRLLWFLIKVMLIRELIVLQPLKKMKLVEEKKRPACRMGGL